MARTQRSVFRSVVLFCTLCGLGCDSETFKNDCNTCYGTGGSGAGGTSGTGGVLGVGGSGGTTTMDAGPPPCTLSANLTFKRDGGYAAWQDINQLTATTFTVTRNYLHGYLSPGDAGTTTCSPQLPACGASVVSIATINADLANADVQGAFNYAQTGGTVYGEEYPYTTNELGNVYIIALDDGRTLVVGAQCASPAMSSCRYIPAGLLKLTSDLQSLAGAMVTDPACKGL